MFAPPLFLADTQAHLENFDAPLFLDDTQPPVENLDAPLFLGNTEPFVDGFMFGNVSLSQTPAARVREDITNSLSGDEVLHGRLRQQVDTIGPYLD